MPFWWFKFRDTYKTPLKQFNFMVYNKKNTNSNCHRKNNDRLKGYTF